MGNPERTTSDVDLMVELEDASFWKELLISHGYEVFHESSSFIQSKPHATRRSGMTAIPTFRRTQSQIIANPHIRMVTSPRPPSTAGESRPRTPGGRPFLVAENHKSQIASYICHAQHGGQE